MAQFYLFFDEVQEVQGWEKAVNSLRVKFHADIYITGQYLDDVLADKGTDFRQIVLSYNHDDQLLSCVE